VSCPPSIALDDCRVVFANSGLTVSQMRRVAALLYSDWESEPTLAGLPETSFLTWLNCVAAPYAQSVVDLVLALSKKELGS
jgi:hypothetical protein